MLLAPIGKFSVRLSNAERLSLHIRGTYIANWCPGTQRCMGDVNRMIARAAAQPAEDAINAFRQFSYHAEATNLHALDNLFDTGMPKGGTLRDLVFTTSDVISN